MCQGKFSKKIDRSVSFGPDICESLLVQFLSLMCQGKFSKKVDSHLRGHDLTLSGHDGRVHGPRCQISWATMSGFTGHDVRV